MLTLLAPAQSEVTHLQDLGCGTFGNVWLGHNATFGKVAVKTVKVSAPSLQSNSQSFTYVCAVPGWQQVLCLWKVGPRLHRKSHMADLSPAQLDVVLYSTGLWEGHLCSMHEILQQAN